MKSSDTSALFEVIREQNKTIEALRKTIEEMTSESKVLREQIEYLNRRLLGRKTEKTAALNGQIVLEGIFDPVQLDQAGQFNEAETEADYEEMEDIVVKKASRKGYSREKALISLPREEKIYALSDEEQGRSIDGDRLFFAEKNTSERKLNTRPPP